LSLLKANRDFWPVNKALTAAREERPSIAIKLLKEETRTNDGGEIERGFG